LDSLMRLDDRQGGDPSAVEHPDIRNSASVVKRITAPESAGSYVATVNALSIGRASVSLGAGRRSKDDEVDPLAGIYLLKKESDPISPGEELCEIHASTTERIEGIIEEVESAFSYTETPFSVPSRLRNRYADGNWMHPVAPASV